MYNFWLWRNPHWATIVNDRIRPPRQDRSQETMNRILDAFERLLRSRPYAKLMINDIAREAKTGAGSIYARFRDKRSILLAVQDRLRNRAREHFAELYDPRCWADTSLEKALERVVRGNLAWHRQHRNIIKSSLLMDDRDILEAISEAFAPVNLNFSLLIRHHMPNMTAAGSIDAAARILRVVMAVFHQMVIFDDVAATGHDLSDNELLRTLVLAALAQVPSQSPNRKKRGSRVRVS
jgi:AcrR family transcriptional regulator